MAEDSVKVVGIIESPPTASCQAPGPPWAFPQFPEHGTLSPETDLADLDLVPSRPEQVDSVRNKLSRWVSWVARV